MLNLSKNLKLPDREKIVPNVLVSNDAFPLGPNILKSFAEHQDRVSRQIIFNYSLSITRKVAENAFGLLTTVFSVIFRTT